MAQQRSNTSTALYCIIIVCLVTMVMLVPTVNSYGRLIEPAMRSSLWRFDSRAAVNYNDHGLDCGGPQVQFRINRGQCGVCGDPHNAPRDNQLGGRYDSGIIARRYRFGSDVTMVADLLSAKGGYFEVKLCPRNDPKVAVTQACFDQYPLQIKNGDGLRMRVPDASKESNGLFRLDVRLPRGVACTHCVIQWKYHAANEWGYDSNGRGCLGCGPQTEIYNCADVAIGYYGDAEGEAGQPADLSMGPLAERISMYTEGTGVSSLIVNWDQNAAWASANQLTTSSRGGNTDYNNNDYDYYYDYDGNGATRTGRTQYNKDKNHHSSSGYANLMSSTGNNRNMNGLRMYDYDFNMGDDYGFDSMMMMMGALAGGGGGGSSEEEGDMGNFRMSSGNTRFTNSFGASRQRNQRLRGGGGGSGGSSEEGGGRRRTNRRRNNANNINRNNAVVIPSLRQQYQRMNVGTNGGRGGEGSSEEDSGEGFRTGPFRMGNQGTVLNNPRQNRQELINGLNNIRNQVQNQASANNNLGSDEDDDEEGGYGGYGGALPSNGGGRGSDSEEEEGVDYGERSPSQFDENDVPNYFKDKGGSVRTDGDDDDYDTGNLGNGAAAGGSGGYGKSAGTNGIDYNTGKGNRDYGNYGDYETPVSEPEPGAGQGLEPVAVSEPEPEPATGSSGGPYVDGHGSSNVNGNGGYGANTNAGSGNYNGGDPNYDYYGGTGANPNPNTDYYTDGVGSTGTGAGGYGNTQGAGPVGNNNNNNNNNGGYGGTTVGLNGNTDYYDETGTYPNADYYDGVGNNADGTGGYGNIQGAGGYGNNQGTGAGTGVGAGSGAGGYNQNPIAGNNGGYGNTEELSEFTDNQESGLGIRLPYTHPSENQHGHGHDNGHEHDHHGHHHDDNNDDDRRKPNRRPRIGPMPWYMSPMGLQGGPYNLSPWGVSLNAAQYGRGIVPYSHIAALLSTLNAPHMKQAPMQAKPAYYNNGNGPLLPWMPGATEVMAMGAQRSPLFSSQIANHYMSPYNRLSQSHPSLQCQRPDQLICVATPAYRGIPNADQICTSKCRSGGACGSEYCSCACQKTLVCIHHTSPQQGMPGGFGVTEMDMWCTNQCNSGQCPNQLCACNVLL